MKTNPDTVAHLETLANVYGAEPNPDIDGSLLREYQQFKTWLRNKDPAIAPESSHIDVLDLLSKIIKSQNETNFANVLTLLKIAVTHLRSTVSNLSVLSANSDY